MGKGMGLLPAHSCLDCGQLLLPLLSPYYSLTTYDITKLIVMLA